MSAALVALFAPYCEGANRAEQLEQALQLLADGALEGVRRLRPEGGHRFQLTWTAAPSPLELSACTLRFPATPEVHYSFDLPTHHLVHWLMDWLAQGGAQAGPDGHPADLPASFWQWLLVGAIPPTAPA